MNIWISSQNKVKKKYFKSKKITVCLGHKRVSLHQKINQKLGYLNFEVMWKKCTYKSCRSFYYQQLWHLTFFCRTCSLSEIQLKRFLPLTSRPQMNYFFLIFVIFCYLIPMRFILFYSVLRLQPWSRIKFQKFLPSCSWFCLWYRNLHDWVLAGFFFQKCTRLSSVQWYFNQF